MNSFTYDELLVAFKDMEKKKPRPQCLRIGPRRDENVPNTKVFFFTSKREKPLECNGSISHKDSFSNVGYKYTGFERRKVSFSVDSVCKNIVFGSTGEKNWDVQDLLLEPPDIEENEDYFLRLLRRLVKPSATVCSGENDNLVYEGEVPVDVGIRPLDLSIQVCIS